MNKNIVKKFIEPRAYTFEEFCQKFKKLKIPIFQRAYVWQPKQINTLWEDMTTNESEYFIGNIVCLDSSDEFDERLEIIDGQQRLFTIFLFSTAVRDECRKNKTNNEEEKLCFKNYIEAVEKILYEKDIHPPFKKTLRLLPGKPNLEEIYQRLTEGSFDINDKDEFKKLDDNQKRYVKNS